MINAGELIEAWRADVLDDVEPYLWSRAEALRYAEAAYRRFVRLTGGIHDFTSPLTRVDIVAGQELADVSPLILRFDKALRESDGREITIANWTDQNLMRRDDYGISSFLYNDRAPGEDYVTLATGRDFLDVSPMRGVIRGGARHALNVAVTVAPLDELPATPS